MFTAMGWYCAHNKTILEDVPTGNENKTISEVQRERKT
jgi:hypothetical protein